MAATINLGRDYTVAGLTGVSDLEMTYSGERIDVTTRYGAKPIKRYKTGFPDKTFTCTVLAKADTFFTVGKQYTVTLAGDAFTLICMDANREEPQEGIINYKLTMKPGEESEVDNQVQVGPGTYRT